MTDLTPKQQRFVEEYLVDSNGKQAAIRCGYKSSRAERTASELLAIRKVSAAVAEGRAKLSERIGRTIDDAMADIRRRGQLAEEAEDWGPAIKAAELEAKHLGAFVERMEHSGPNGGPIPVARVERVIVRIEHAHPADTDR